VAHPTRDRRPAVEPVGDRHETDSPAAWGSDLVNTLADALHEISSARSLDQVAAAVVDAVSREIPDSGGCALYLVDESAHSLRPYSVATCQGSPVPWADIPLDSEVSRRVFGRRACASTGDARLVGEVIRQRPGGEYPILLTVPLGGDEGAVGMIGVCLRSPDVCSGDCARVLEIIAGCAVLAVRRGGLPSSDALYGKALFDSIPAGLVVTDAEGNVAAANATMRAMIRTLGTADLTLPCTIRENSCPDCLVCLLDPCKGTVVGPYSASLGLAGSAKQTYQVIPAPMVGSGAGRIYVVLDVTKDRLTAQARSHFAAQVAHELRTPIQHIMGFASILTDVDELEDDTFRRFLSHISDESKRLARLVDDLADLSHLDNGRFSISKAPTRIDDTVSSVVERLQPTAKSAGVEVKAPEACAHVTVVTDRMRVEQVLLNLIENALKFTPGGGEVTVSCQARRADLTLSVSDNGPGIPQDAQERIFERYYQIPGTRARSTRVGMGLGLYITRQIVHALGGRIWVDSELGKGSTFSFCIPRE